MSNERPAMGERVAGIRDRVSTVQERAQRTLVWQVWDRMLEIEFIDRSVALAGKAFVSFFPLVIVVAAFTPPGVRDSIYTTITHKLGIRGAALADAKQAFKSSDDVRRATGILGLVFTVFFATSFTTALQRVYLRAWRRPPGNKVGEYARGIAWFLAILIYLGVLGALRNVIGDGPLLALFFVVSLIATCTLWWFTAWSMLLGQVRRRVLIPTGIVTGVVLGGYALSASIWMPNVVSKNQNQFGFFGVALALVTWFSGAATCILIGACAGAVVADDTGSVGRLIRGPDDAVLVEGAEPSIPAPPRMSRLKAAFQSEEST